MRAPLREEAWSLLHSLQKAHEEVIQTVKGEVKEKGDRLEELVTSEKTASRPQEGTETGTHSIPSALTPAPYAAAQIHQGREEVTVLAQQ